ncbi:MAG: peptidoglycan-binding protein [Patescibacteria group bacterium]|nr:peptidoglycan-binding protein [Patescibacteria group bacterium]MDE1945821.1 peptidoglycan-binding protein [Patescibacteria group bacterium]
MKKFGLKTLATSAVALAMTFSMVGMTVAQAAALTSAQVSAIVSLLQSFGADAGTIANVEASLTGTPVVTTTTSAPAMTSSYTFTSDLTIGSKGAAVTALQNFLIAQGDLGASYNTGYFGSLTQAALAKFQAAEKISPAAGYFGPKTRAIVNGMAGGVSVSTGSTSGTVTSAGSVSVALAATSPVNSTVVSPSATALLAQYVFSGTGTVTKVVLQRTGVSSDSTLNNVYLYQGATRLTDAASVANGVISFSNPNGLFMVNGSMTVSVRADIATGQGSGTVGVSLTSLTLSGATAAVNVNVAGSTQNIAGATNPASVLLGGGSDSNNVANSSVNAGTMNYNVWSVPVSVSTRSVYLNALTLKFIGSANPSAFQNLALYVDGSKVGTSAGINANSFVVFDLSASPYTLTTGSHTIEVHADIVGGANYSGQFVLQNQADIMLADSQLQGVYVAAITNQSNSTFSQNSAGTISINAGSIVVQQDPSFNPTVITGGSTNVAIAQYTLADYGEAVKISQIQVQPVLTNATASTGATSSLNNVGLYVNGAQVGTLQNWTGTTLTYNLGSSLTVQAGQTVTLTVKADTINSAFGSYTGGSVAVQLSGTTNNAQGMTSNSLSTIPSTTITSNAITLGTAAVTLSKNAAYSNQSILANTANQEIGSFVIQAGANENVQLTSLALGITGTLPLTSLSNLRTTEQTNTIAAPSATNNFSVNDTINSNLTKEIDVFADVGAIPSTPTLTKSTGTATVSGYFDSGMIAEVNVNGQQFKFTSSAASSSYAYVASQLTSVINGSSTSPVTASLSIGTSSAVITLTSTTGGSGSNYTLTNTGTTGGTVTVSGANMTGGSTTTLSTATIQTTLSATLRGMTSNLTITPAAATGQQITVASGATGINGSIVNTSPTAQYVVGGSSFPVVVYNATSSVGTAVITEMDFANTENNSTIVSVTVGGVTAPMASGTAIVTGLNISVPAGFAGVNIPVSVKYNTVGLNGLSTDNSSSTLKLTLVKSQNGSSAIQTNSGLSISSNTMKLVATKPTVTVSTPAGATLAGTTEVADVTVSADAAGDINLDQLPVTIAANGGSLSIGTQTVGVYDQNNSLVTQATGTIAVSNNANATVYISFLNGVSTGYRIPAGTSQTFRIKVNPTNYAATAGTLSLATQLASSTNFLWTDIQGNSAESGLTGSSIFNYPTNVSSVTN